MLGLNPQHWAQYTQRTDRSNQYTIGLEYD